MRDNRVVELIASSVAIVASLTVVAAFLMSVTKTPRLVRRANSLKDALDTFPEDSTRHQVLSQMHLEATAQIVARHLTPAWRVLWPWLVWTATVVVTAQSGYQTVRYLVDTDGLNYTDYSIAAFGDVPGPAFLLFAALGPLPMVCASYLVTLLGRADVALAFFNGDAIDRTPTYTELSSAQPETADGTTEKIHPIRLRDRVKGVGPGLLAWLQLVAPGVFVLAFGFLVGLSVGMNTIDPTSFKGSGDAKRTFMIDQLGSLPGIMALVVSASACLMLWAITEFLSTARESKLPTHYPVDVPTGKVEALGTEEAMGVEA